MKQAIAGVAPPESGEVTIMTVWPSLASRPMGRWWGRMYLKGGGFTCCGIPVTVGRMIALASIPAILPPYFLMLLPCLVFIPKLGPIPRVFIPNPFCRRYRLTNRRVIIEDGTGVEQSSVSLDDFDSVEVEVLPGQEWYPAGELVFRHGKVETFRLSGVPHPQGFRHTCIKAQLAHSTVQHAVSHQTVGV